MEQFLLHFPEIMDIVRRIPSNAPPEVHEMFKKNLFNNYQNLQRMNEYLKKKDIASIAYIEDTRPMGFQIQFKVPVKTPVGEATTIMVGIDGQLGASKNGNANSNNMTVTTYLGRKGKNLENGKVFHDALESGSLMDESYPMLVAYLNNL